MSTLERKVPHVTYSIISKQETEEDIKQMVEDSTEILRLTIRSNVHVNIREIIG